MKKVNFFLSALLALIITSSMVFMPVLADDLTVYSEWNFSDKKVGENTGYTPNGLTAAVADAGGGAVRKSCPAPHLRPASSFGPYM